MPALLPVHAELTDVFDNVLGVDNRPSLAVDADHHRGGLVEHPVLEDRPQVYEARSERAYDIGVISPWSFKWNIRLNIIEFE
jgi:hypothetical protein